MLLGLLFGLAFFLGMITQYCITKNSGGSNNGTSAT